MSDRTGREKVLNLYSGVGGNRKLWSGMDVTAVEINDDEAAEYQRQCPDDDVVVADAHEFLRSHYDDGWDFIWSSPPCQSHSKMTYTTWFMERCSGPSYPDMNLYEEIIFLDQFCKGDWVVENVDPWYVELLSGKSIGRHVIWSNYHIPDFEEPHRDFELTEANKDRLENWLGVELSDTIYLDNNDPSQILRNAVHPEVGEHIFQARKESLEQTTLPAVADGGESSVSTGTDHHSGGDESAE
jgi:DNA (cytosine-5)-methyltransferase 1